MKDLQIGPQNLFHSVPTLLSMPAEVIERILQHLSPNLKDISRATRTCKYLYDFLPKFLLQNSLYLSSFLSQALQNRRIEAPLATLRAELYPHPIALIITCSERGDIARFKEVLEKFPDLASLHIVINNKELFPEIATLLSQKAQVMSHLKIQGSIQAQDIVLIMQNCKMLSSLDLGMCKCNGVYDIYFNLLADMRSSSLLWIRVDPASFGFNSKPYDELFKTCPQLEYIQLAHQSLNDRTLYRNIRLTNGVILMVLRMEALNKITPAWPQGLPEKFSVQDLRYPLESVLRVLHSVSYDTLKGLDRDF